MKFLKRITPRGQFLGVDGEISKYRFTETALSVTQFTEDVLFVLRLILVL